MIQTRANTLTVEISDDQAAFVRDAVSSGRYASEEEVVRAGLDLMRTEERFNFRQSAALKRAYEDGMASGEGRRVDAATLLAELKAEQRRRA